MSRRGVGQQFHSAPVIRSTPLPDRAIRPPQTSSFVSFAIFPRSLRSLPSGDTRRKGRYGLHDYEKMFCADIKGGHDIFAMRGIDREAGCMVVVRSDQYVAQVLPPLDGYK